jgi:hypothetical protein
MRRTSLAKAASFVAVVTLALLPAARAHAADVPISEEARTHFAAGVVLLQDPKAPRYEDAYREFKAAYAASPSYKILGNLGLCAMKIERDAEAIDAYEKYLKEAGPDLLPAEREQAERDLLALKTGVVRVTVSSDPPGASMVDVRTPVEGTDVRNAYGEAKAPLALGLRRGHHVITARLAGYQDQQWEFETSGTTLPPHVFKMVRTAGTFGSESRATRPMPTAAWISGGATLGLALTGVVVAIAAGQARNAYDSENDGLHLTQATSDRNRGETLNTIADGFFGAAFIGAILTSYFVLSRPTVERPNTATGPVPRLAPMPLPLGTLGSGAPAGVAGGIAAAWTY